MTVPQSVKEAEDLGRSAGEYAISTGWPYPADFDHPTALLRAWASGWAEGDAARRNRGMPSWAHPEIETRHFAEH